MFERWSATRYHSDSALAHLPKEYEIPLPDERTKENAQWAIIEDVRFLLKELGEPNAIISQTPSESEFGIDYDTDELADYFCEFYRISNGTKHVIAQYDLVCDISVDDTQVSLGRFALRNLFGGNRVLYCSVPITTGPRYFDYLRSGGDPNDREARRKLIVEPNIAEGQKIIDEIREREECCVIDPTRFESKCVCDWPQKKFYKFWDVVVQGAASAVVFLDGWQYSTGCSNELLSAMKSGKPIRDQRLKPISLEEAISMVQKSIEEYAAFGIDNAGLRKVMEKLRG